MMSLLAPGRAEEPGDLADARVEKASASARTVAAASMNPPPTTPRAILYLPAEARFDYLLNRPEAENIGAKVNAAMRDIEKHNPQLFWFKALVIASNGTDYCVNSLMADWEVRAHGQTDSQMVAIRLQWDGEENVDCAIHSRSCGSHDSRGMPGHPRGLRIRPLQGCAVGREVRASGLS